MISAALVPGFLTAASRKLLASICESRVDAVDSVEASWLSRNGRDWHTLLELCGLVGTLIADEGGVYDSRHSHEGLLLGRENTTSEMELSLFRQRELEAPAEGTAWRAVPDRGDRLPETSYDRVEQDPDHRAQEAIMLAFEEFAEL